MSDIVLLENLPDDVRRDVTAYVGCISGAELLHDYLLVALDAGLTELSIPQILHGSSVASVLAPDGNSTCCGSQMVDVAARAVASIKLHGRKPSM